MSAIILGVIGTALNGIFILFNYQFFDSSYVHLLVYEEAFHGREIYPIMDRIVFAYFLICYLTLIFFRYQTSVKEESNVRKILLDLSTKHTRLEVRELSERTKTDADTLKRVALPGYSEHGYPLRQGVDIGTFEPVKDIKDFVKTEEYKWLKNNASQFGFYLSFPKGNKSGVMFEPWHWHYKPTDV